MSNITSLRHQWIRARMTGIFTPGLKKTLNLWKRHNGVCHICEGHVPHPVLEAELLTDSNYPSRDHVVPISRDGPRDVENVKLAHRKCNRLKGCTLMKDLSKGVLKKVWQFSNREFI